MGSARSVRRAIGVWMLPALLLLLLASCGGGQPSATGAPPDAVGVPPGWTEVGDERVYDKQSIYELVNGQAGAYFAYNFEQVTVRSYEDETGAVVDAEIWQVATPSDAYGLFTNNRAGEGIEIGNGGDVEPGRRLAFWQDRTYVRVRARQEIPDEALLGIAEAIAGTLPSGGERPALVDRLPTGGLVPESVIYFRRESSMQSELWLGGENLLGMDIDTEGVLARYDIGGAVVRLLLVKVADTEAAHAGMSALDSAGMSDLIATGVQGPLLAAVFGDIDEGDARSLVADALLSE